MSIGERIKQRREQLGMSQEDLAHKIGYKSRSSINKIELNIQQLRQTKIAQIAKALHTTPTWILGMECEDDQICDHLKVCYGKHPYYLVEMFLKLDADDQEDIIALVENKLSRAKYKK